MLKIAKYDVSVTTQYVETIGYTGGISLLQQADFPGTDKLLAAIPLGAPLKSDSNRQAIIGNNGGMSYIQLNASQSGVYLLSVLYVYRP